MAGYGGVRRKSSSAEPARPLSYLAPTFRPRILDHLAHGFFEILSVGVFPELRFRGIGQGHGVDGYRVRR